MRIAICVCLCALLFVSFGLAQGPIFVPGAMLKVEIGNGAGGEGPAWHPKLGVLSSGNGHIMRLDLEGRSRVHRFEAGTNGLLFDRKGRLLACEPVKRRITRTELDGTIVVLTERYGRSRYNQPNDISVDSTGRIYFSDTNMATATAWKCATRRASWSKAFTASIPTLR